MAVTLVYSKAYGRTSAGEPKNRRSGRVNNSVITASTTPHNTNSTAAFPIILTARFRLPPPIARLNAEEPPIPNKSAKAKQEVDSGNAILVAAFPNSPTR